MTCRDEEDTVARGCAFVVVLVVLLAAAFVVVGCAVLVREELCVEVLSKDNEWEFACENDEVQS